jgi:transcriptional regulator with XRE-family HTH domain
MLMQKLRLKRGWSQQQLAEASGLSVRTIQRIETGHPASVETLKSVAAVFEVDFSTLNPEQTMTTSDSTLVQNQEEEAFRYVRRLRRFYIHVYQYIIVVSVLFAMNLITSPHRLWAVWVMLGWGLGVLMHASTVFGRSWLLGPEWERRQVEKRLGRPL